MPRKKPAALDAAQTNSGTATAVAEPGTKGASKPMTRPSYIDGPPVTPDGEVDAPASPEAKNWGDPYKAIVKTADFEMGENRRFKQRLFKFKEKPAEDVLATLKDHGFTYRMGEKAWTIQANPDTRNLTDELAREFAGQSQGVSR